MTISACLNIYISLTKNLATKISFYLLLAASFTPFTSVVAQTQVVFVNQTGLPDDAVFVTMQGAANFSGVTDGGGGGLSQNTSYSLQQLYGTVSGATSGGPTGTMIPTLSATTFNTGALMQITLGQKIGSSNPSNSIVSGRVEPFIDGSSFSNNFDSSYVSSYSLPTSYAIKQRDGGTLVPLIKQANQISTDGTAGFSALTANTSITPNSARNAANYSVLDSNNNSVGTMTGIASILAPQNTTGYHNWTGPNTGNRSTSGLIPYMQTQGSVTVASYTVPLSAPLNPGNVIGFGGSSGTSPFGVNDPDGRFLKAQDYNLSAQFTADMNPGGANADLTAQGITAGTEGVIFTGSGGDYSNGDTGTFNVYITNAELENITGIYGANPEYVILWDDPSLPSGNLAVTTGNTNSLTDRIVGDLLTGINMGWTDSQTTIDTHATATNTTDKLVGTIFAGNTDMISELTTGQFIYLLDVQQQEGTVTESTVPLWFGEYIETNSLFYNTYGSALGEHTDAYTLSYSDRLAGSLSPDIFFTPADGTVALGDLYIEVTLGEGGYTFTAVPEPSQSALILSVGALVLCWVRRRYVPRT